MTWPKKEPPPSREHKPTPAPEPTKPTREQVDMPAQLDTTPVPKRPILCIPTRAKAR